MDRDEVEEWVAAVIAALRPALLAQAVMWEHLDVAAPPPKELAETLVALLVAHEDEPGASNVAPAAVDQGLRRRFAWSAR